MVSPFVPSIFLLNALITETNNSVDRVFAVFRRLKLIGKSGVGRDLSFGMEVGGGLFGSETTFLRGRISWHVLYVTRKSKSVRS